MQRKAQMGLGIFLATFVAIIVALALFQGSVGFIGTATNTFTLVNGTYTAPAAGSTIDLLGQDITSTPVVTNSTGGEVIPATNYTIAETVSAVDGLKRISFTSDGGHYSGLPMNVSYDYGAEGYIDSPGGRSLAGLIAVFAALAIAVIAISPVLREKIFG